MSDRRYVVGVDFGTESGRAVLVDAGNGSQVAVAVVAYEHGVIDDCLPGGSERLPPDWALQHPGDYLAVLRQAIPAVLKTAGVDAVDVIGVGVDFTSCTVLPVRQDGTPLCLTPELGDDPHAWVKLWKHHAAQPYSETMNRVARERGESWLWRYGGKISAEWLFPKALQMLSESPAVYKAADRFVEAGDWIVWQLVGREERSACAAGYKALWSPREGFPSADYFAALDPRFRNVVDEKCGRAIHRLEERAGEISEAEASLTGLRPGTPVAIAIIDAHACVPAVGVTQPGQMVLVMGTSTCHMLLSDESRPVDGICGVVEDGIIRGLAGYEAGQPSVGDSFAWLVENLTPSHYRRAAERQGCDVHAVLEREAAKLKPGQSGLLALDWWNGNRSILANSELSGAMLGMNLQTNAPEMYRALIEATAFGTRVIIENFERSGLPVRRLVACGGLAERNRLVAQVYADVTGRTIEVAETRQAAALGAAMYGAVAAGFSGGGYDSLAEAVAHMAGAKHIDVNPTPAHMQTYDRLFAEYLQLHDYFGSVGETMKRLRAIRANALGH